MLFDWAKCAHTPDMFAVLEYDERTYACVKCLYASAIPRKYRIATFVERHAPIDNGTYELIND